MLLAEIKDLECPGLSLKRNNLLGPVHNGTVGLDRSANNIVAILEFDDDYFRGGGLILLFADADEGIGFEGLKLDVSQRSEELRMQGTDAYT